MPTISVEYSAVGPCSYCLQRTPSNNPGPRLYCPCYPGVHLVFMKGIPPLFIFLFCCRRNCHGIHIAYDCSHSQRPDLHGCVALSTLWSQFTSCNSMTLLFIIIPSFLPTPDFRIRDIAARVLPWSCLRNQNHQLRDCHNGGSQSLRPQCPRTDGRHAPVAEGDFGMSGAEKPRVSSRRS